MWLIGFKVEVIESEKKIKNDLIILPGVGSFPRAMKYLINTGLDKRISEYSKTKKPLIGICLGMQLLFDKSEEFKKVKGLSLIEGEVKKIPNKAVKFRENFRPFAPAILKEFQHEIINDMKIFTNFVNFL